MSKLEFSSKTEFLSGIVSITNKMKSSIVCVYWVLLLVTVRTSSSAQVNNTCPPSVALPKCKCYQETHSPFYLTVDCLGLNGLDDLNQSLEPFHGKKVNNFRFMSSNFPHIPKGSFSKIPVLILSFYKCNFTRMAGEGAGTIFDGLELKLIDLSFTFCQMKEGFDWSQLRNLRSLKTVAMDMFKDAKGRTGPAVKQNTTMINFGDISSVAIQMLHVSGTDLSQLGDRALTGNRHLEHLSLPDNALTGIMRTELPKPAYRLKVVIFRRNRIKHIPEDFFNDMPVLKSVDFAGNLLHTFNQYLLAPMFPKLRMLALSENPVNCDQNILWITQASLLGITLPDWNDFEYVQCFNPPKLRNKALMSVTEAEVEMENDI